MSDTEHVDEHELARRLDGSAEARLLADVFPSFLSYVDADYVYRFVNRAYEDRLDKPRDQIIGRPITAVSTSASTARSRSPLHSSAQKWL